MDVLAQTLRELNIYITHDDEEELGRQARLGVWQKVFVSHTDIWRWVLFLADPTLLYWQGNGNDDECKNYSLITTTRLKESGCLVGLYLTYFRSIDPPPLSFKFIYTQHVFHLLSQNKVLLLLKILLMVVMIPMIVVMIFLLLHVAMGTIIEVVLEKVIDYLPPFYPLSY